MGRTRSILSPRENGGTVRMETSASDSALTNSGREVGKSLAWSIPGIIVNTTELVTYEQERCLAHSPGGQQVQHGDTGTVPSGKPLFLVYTRCLLAVPSPGGRLEGFPGALNPSKAPAADTTTLQGQNVNV